MSQYSYFGVNCASMLTSQFKDVGYEPYIISVTRALVLREHISLQLRSLAVILLFHWFELKKTG